MPAVSDIVRSTLVQELSGVQMSNAIYWRVNDLGAAPTREVGLTDIMNGYADAVKPTLTPAWALVCGILENITAVEAKALVFVNITGTGAIDSHPQDQVIRINRYANSAAPLAVKLRVAGFHQSGVIESLSTRGRVNDLAEFLNIKNFLRVQQIFGANWTLTPMVQIRETVGPPPTYQYQAVAQGIVNPKFQKLRSRKTSLCVG